MVGGSADGEGFGMGGFDEGAEVGVESGLPGGIDEGFAAGGGPDEVDAGGEEGHLVLPEKRRPFGPPRNFGGSYWALRPRLPKGAARWALMEANDHVNIYRTCTGVLFGRKWFMDGDGGNWMGVYPGELSLVVGRAGVGKSLLALDMEGRVLAGDC